MVYRALGDHWVVSRIFRTFNLAERHPALGHAVMAPLICWSFSNSMFRSRGRPRRAGDVAQPRGGEVERRLTVRKGAHDAGAPPDLAQDALERVVGANPPPILRWEGVVGERLLDRHFHQLGGAAQAKATQLLDHSDDGRPPPTLLSRLRSRQQHPATVFIGNRPSAATTAA